MKIQRGHKCELCGRVFLHYYKLERHMVSHTGEKAYKCDTCSKRFAHKETLSVHLPIHSKERSFKCTICPASFKIKQYLVGHQRTHSLERPFKCTTCSASFKQKSNLNSHFRIHKTDRKFFQCDACGKKLSSNSSLLKHQIFVHKTEERSEKFVNFLCVFCKRRFRSFLGLENHIRLHINERPFMCKVCTKAYPSKKSFSCHGKKHFSIERKREKTVQ